ncbi:Na+/H+ antiporter subunit E [Dethiosulfovibrio salsuginis]|uniref:Multicomponent Na+:H+ antiporter subunit E n=1 Tax=Dethiosulfovibrio salsuginis TaxID=561720 RepID=A0A1X7JZY3_9BACT|nr:Na+/H+ antiporter subunit E [Dethiosulfovibrio salsuginis]SMG34094.1 multicomponent Na+:H+ antiporter subunit E [Dethiosulfovibrio salsuginis]
MSTQAKMTGLFSSLLILWIALTGRIDLPFILVGAIISALVVRVVWKTFFSGVHDFPLGDHVWKGINWIPLLCFVPCFFFDLIKSTWDVSILALRPNLSLAPAIIQTQSGLTSKTALVLLANQITLTPGTLTLDADISHHKLYIHVLTINDQEIDGIKDQIHQLEARIEGITG